MAFSLPDFLPYLLNQAAEAASREFQSRYRSRYGMLRTEWRVLFHLGCYGELSAKQICERASIHKTKVSRAVAALQAKRYVSRTTDPDDRRREVLSLTRAGKRVFDALQVDAEECEAKLTAVLTPQEQAHLRSSLAKLMHFGS
ncbi:MarR family winged helix-turn-helix transcriptional regulator [Oceanibium sediminis]|uniref:MarR family winged helix-turn-helix transcriptional regulator n=1 Tax=Oceanibium sediminis TaxID=2026339 RepID=UPI001E34FB7C|nr:MarR family winged helix-turn-helix transcriptional regulator [Oceanibium sediminis]